MKARLEAMRDEALAELAALAETFAGQSAFALAA